jgi:hypothetical protein
MSGQGSDRDIYEPGQGQRYPPAQGELYQPEPGELRGGEGVIGRSSLLLALSVMLTLLTGCAGGPEATPFATGPSPSWATPAISSAPAPGNSAPAVSPDDPHTVLDERKQTLSCTQDS